MNDNSKSDLKKSRGRILPLWALMDLPFLGQPSTPIVVANFNKKNIYIIQY